MSKVEKSMSSVTAALVGAAVGAVAVLMSHRDTRKKAKGKLMEMLDEGDTKLDQLQDKAQEATKKGKSTLAGKLGQASEKLAEPKKSKRKSV